MYTQGFVPSSSDAITIGTPFSASVAGVTTFLTSTYIYVGTGGGGNIVWRNVYGDLNWLPGVVAGQTYIIGATEIVASGTVNGTARTTTASALTFLASNNIS
jgi:hypothetical protein